MTRKRKNAAERVAEFNAKAPVGTRVRYWPGIREGEGRLGKVRHEAYVFGEVEAVCMVTGQAGCVALSHVEVVGAECQEKWTGECRGSTCAECQFCQGHAYEANRQGEGRCGDCVELAPEGR